MPLPLASAPPLKLPASELRILPTFTKPASTTAASDWDIFDSGGVAYRGIVECGIHVGLGPGAVIAPVSLFPPSHETVAFIANDLVSERIFALLRGRIVTGAATGAARRRALEQLELTTSHQR